jgi:hypothetical protein
MVFGMGETVDGMTYVRVCMLFIPLLLAHENI